MLLYLNAYSKCLTTNLQFLQHPIYFIYLGQTKDHNTSKHSNSRH